jgi:hypothetical protein
VAVVQATKGDSGGRRVFGDVLQMADKRNIHGIVIRDKCTEFTKLFAGANADKGLGKSISKTECVVGDLGSLVLDGDINCTTKSNGASDGKSRCIESIDVDNVGLGKEGSGRNLVRGA